MYPLEKYKYYKNGNKIIAVSTYAGKTVRGVAICGPNDSFDEEKGKKLAALRCAEKVARKRFARAIKKQNDAEAAYIKAGDYYDRMTDYSVDSQVELVRVCKAIDDLLKEI